MESALEQRKMQSFISDAVNHKGHPADRSKTGGWLSAALILGIEVCERLSTMGIVVNLVTYLVGTMHLPSSTASNAATNFGGTGYILCLLGGIISDSFLGRYRTIMISAGISALGTSMLALSTSLPQLRPPTCNPTISDDCIQASNTQMGIFYASLYAVVIGTGGIKSSVSGFGTDQFDKNDEKEKSQMTSFFNLFVVIINIGTLLATTVLVYIQDNVGRGWGYGICSGMMLTALVSFLLGTRRYRYKEHTGSPIVQIFQVLVAALRKRKVELPSDASLLYEDHTQESRIGHTDQYYCLDKAAIPTSDDNKAAPNPWRLCTVTTVEEVKMLVRLLPIWATTIMFWTVYAQMASFSVQQATTMDKSLGNFQVPPSSYNVFLFGSIMVTLSIYDRLVMPHLKKYGDTQGLTCLQKISIGLFFSILAMVAAALVERKRLSVGRAQKAATATLPISAFMLVPQFIFVGIGDAFIYSGQLDFFITQSPKRMKAMGTGLFLTTLSLGLFLSTILVDIVKKITESNGRHNWLPRRINDGRLDYFYGLLALLSAINLGLYIFCAVRFKPSTNNNHQKTDCEVEMHPSDPKQKKV